MIFVETIRKILIKVLLVSKLLIVAHLCGFRSQNNIQASKSLYIKFQVKKDQRWGFVHQ